MLVKVKRGWELPESRATPEAIFWNRRSFLRAAGIGAAGGGAGIAGIGQAQAAASPIADLFPAPTDTGFVAGRPTTPEETASTYNNFYEFGSHKRISRAAQDLKTRPWTVKLDGMVESEREVDIDTLIRAMPVEERVYRLRCVEAWSMVIPWTGLPLASLVAYPKPGAGAKYVVMQTFLDPDVASGQKQFWYPWPYIEGLTLAEATNDLAFMVIGAYGKPLANQFGAPMRLAVPWKYGFKSVKSIVRLTFTDKRPVSFWEQIQASEYGFWANVNPEVSHPRWSQATEEVIGTGERIPTLKWNGYGEQVAHLYDGLDGETLFR